jgi:putative ABC transport system permease protein
MVGIALVAFFLVLGDSVKASAGRAITQGMRGEFVLTPEGFTGGVSPTLASELRGLPEIATTTSLRTGYWDHNGSAETLAAIEADTASRTLALDASGSSVADLATGGVLVFVDVADRHGWEVGDVIPMGFSLTGLQQVEVRGVYSERNVVESDYLIDMGYYEDHFDAFMSDADSLVIVKVAEGVTPAVARATIETSTAGYANVTVSDQVEYREAQQAEVDTMMAVFTALLVLAVIIAMFGIANTLALSVYERTHEIGLLRAVGMSRGQVIRTVTWESIIVAVIGAGLGGATGVLFGLTVTTALGRQGIEVLSVPLLQIALLVALGIAAGLVAAMIPARRAAELDILDAIAVE